MYADYSIGIPIPEGCLLEEVAGIFGDASEVYAGPLHPNETTVDQKDSAIHQTEVDHQPAKPVHLEQARESPILGPSLRIDWRRFEWARETARSRPARLGEVDVGHVLGSRHTSGQACIATDISSKLTSLGASYVPKSDLMAILT